jgi:hypothetical protein
LSLAVCRHVNAAVKNGSSIETIFRHAFHRIFYQHIDNRIEVLVREMRAEIEEIGAGSLMPEFKQSTKQRSG